MKKNKRFVPKAGIISIFFSFMIAMLSIVFISDRTIAYSEESLIMEDSTQSSILLTENAVLQNYNIEDLIATQSFLLCRPYEGDGRIIDANEDGQVNVFDLCIMKHDYKETGNYFDLASKMLEESQKINGENAVDFVEIPYTNRLIVQAKSEQDFSAYPFSMVLESPEYLYFVQFDNMNDTKDCLADMNSNPNIEYAQLDEYQEINENNLGVISGVNQQNSWGVSAIEANQYAEYLKNNVNSNVTVAVIDTGVSQHGFMDGRILSNGRDFGNNDYDPSADPIRNDQDARGHGTHVAGTIVDCTPGLDINILPIKVLDYNDCLSDTAIGLGIDYAIAQKVDVINYSIGTTYGERNQYIDAKFKQAVNNGIVTVVSAGNDRKKHNTIDQRNGRRYSGDTSEHSPANLSECIVVGAIGSGYTYASFSNFGSSLDVVAPGISIKSTFPNGSYVTWDGTSMAAPHIAAAAAMIKYEYPNATPIEIEKMLIGTCEDLGTAGFDYDYGNGVPKLSKLIKNKINPSISLSKTSASAYVGDTIQLSASCTPSDASVVWSSSNTSVATVSNGKVVAQGAGDATIIASFVYEGQTYSASCSVSVKTVKIDLNETNKTVYQTDEFNLSAKTEPENLVVSWSSSNNSIASVSNGKVTAINPGTATITASITYAGRTYSSSCNVTVKKVSVELSPKSLSMLIGDSSKINAATSPNGLSVSWSTSNNMVASINNGLVTANAPGNITITASMIYNGKQYTDSCAVTVKEPSIKLAYNQLKMAKNETITMLADTSPSGQSIHWSSEDTSICTISSSGVITAKSIGNTMIIGTITYSGATYSSSCNVIVGEPKVTLSKTSLSMYVSDTQSLVASVIAVDGNTITSDTKSDISWSSSNNSVATVDSNGAVKAVATGTATITAKYTFCGINYTATCSVTVQGKPTISLNKSSLSLYIGDTSTLSAAVTPSGQTVSWSTSNSSIVMINNGKVTAISNGTATITASFRYNGVTYSTTCSVTVTKPSISLSANSYNGFCNSSNNGFWLGDTATLTKSGNIPSTASVNWTSSNTSVVTVNSNGKLTSVNGGSSTITAKFTYGRNTYSSSISVTVLSTNTIRTFTVSPSSGSNGSTVFAFNANVGFIADKVTIQVCSTNKALQSNGSYDYTTYTNEIPIHKSDASHWYYNTTLTGFSSGSYLIRCRAYNGSSSVTAYVNLTIR